jgi:hypothetical protein
VTGKRRSYETESIEVQKAISHAKISREIIKAALLASKYIKTVSPAENERLLNWGRDNIIE